MFVGIRGLLGFVRGSLWGGVFMVFLRGVVGFRGFV